jgi:hypothetical protein
MYLRLGYLESSEAAELTRDWIFGVKSLEPGWTCITDLSIAVADDPRMIRLLPELMRIAVEGGIGRVVRVTGRARVFPALFAKLSREEFGYEAAEVETMAEAEELLAKEAAE